MTLRKRDVTRDIEPMALVEKMVKKYDEKMTEVMKKFVCHMQVPTDTHFSSIRSKETPIGNFIAELIRKYTSADMSLFNSGTIRADKTYEAGFL